MYISTTLVSSMFIIPISKSFSNARDFRDISIDLPAILPVNLNYNSVNYFQSFLGNPYLSSFCTTLVAF